MTVPLGVAVLGVLALAGWGACRLRARRDADEAHRNVLALLADQTDARALADDRAIADNLDI